MGILRTRPLLFSGLKPENSRRKIAKMDQAIGKPQIKVTRPQLEAGQQTPYPTPSRLHSRSSGRALKTHPFY